MNFLSATVAGTARADAAAAFACVVPVDLTSVFTGYGLLPAVTGVQNQVGLWDTPGQTRTVLLSDGSRAQECLTRYEHAQSFGYTVSGFTGVLRLLAASAQGEWQFRGVTSSTTDITWCYTFQARSAFSVPALWCVTHLLWRGYMAQAMRLCIAQIENGVG